MTQQAESKHARALREFQFKPIDKEVSLAVRSKLPMRLSRRARRALRTKKYRPWFTMTDLMTMATDETGQSWTGPANTDLSSLGFENKTEESKKDIRAMRGRDPRYN